MQTHIADANMKKFFEKLLALKEFVKNSIRNEEKLDEDVLDLEEMLKSDDLFEVLKEIESQLDAIIKNGDTNE